MCDHTYIPQRESPRGTIEKDNFALFRMPPSVLFLLIITVIVENMFSCLTTHRSLVEPFDGGRSAIDDVRRRAGDGEVDARGSHQLPQHCHPHIWSRRVQRAARAACQSSPRSSGKILRSCVRLVVRTFTPSDPSPHFLPRGLPSVSSGK